MNLFEVQRPLPSWTQRRSDLPAERPNEARSAYDRDRARILHSAAFRRLQAKTQIVSIGQNDFYRTRLTHSLEVSQIGSSLVRQLAACSSSLEALLPPHALIESLCLAHDIGHPPFGHGGEAALNMKMRDVGHFEGNAQTFRIVSKLEPYRRDFGMDLTRRTLLGLLKYPVTIDELSRRHLVKQDHMPHGNRFTFAEHETPIKGLYGCDDDVLRWVLEPFINEDVALFQQSSLISGKAKTQCKSLDASIMELADDIAYGVHDLEDAITIGNIHQSQWEENALGTLSSSTEDKNAYNILSTLTHNLFSHDSYARKDAIGSLVNTLVTSVEFVESSTPFKEPLLRWNARLQPEIQPILDTLKRVIYQLVIRTPELQRIEFKGQHIVADLFDAFSQYPERLLPENTRKRWQHAQQQTDKAALRVICDYVSGMTDEYAIKMHRQLFNA